MHPAGEGLSRDEVVEQSKNNVEGLYDFANYIPLGNAAGKIKKWKSQGAAIYYLTSRRSRKEVTAIRNVLNHFNFPEGELLYRQEEQAYADVTEKLLPDVLIEDDCQSIGGEKEMIYPLIESSLKDKIVSISVREFAGIDHLPNDLIKLKDYKD